MKYRVNVKLKNGDKHSWTFVYDERTKKALHEIYPEDEHDDCSLDKNNEECAISLMGRAMRECKELDYTDEQGTVHFINTADIESMNIKRDNK